jgi:hypothetical protein
MIVPSYFREELRWSMLTCSTVRSPPEDYRECGAALAGPDDSGNIAQIGAKRSRRARKVPATAKRGVS